MSYYVFKMFLNLYSIQYDRTIMGQLNKAFRKLTGAKTIDSVNEAINELLIENERINGKTKKNIEREDDDIDGRE